MGEGDRSAQASWLPGAAALALATVYVIALLAVEKQSLIIGLLALAIVAVLAANWLGWLAPVSRSFADREDALGALAIVAAVRGGGVLPRQPLRAAAGGHRPALHGGDAWG